MAAASTAASAPDGLQASAFKRIYPDQYYAEFISRHLRPDGRQFEEARHATIGVGTVQSADSSALVKLGSTTVLAGVKLEVGGWHALSAWRFPQQKLRQALTLRLRLSWQLMTPEGDEGVLAVNVEMASFGCASMRPGRPSEAAQCLSAQVSACVPGVHAHNLPALHLPGVNSAGGACQRAAGDSAGGGA